MLEYLIPSKTRRKVIALFFTQIGESIHLRRIAREVSEEINAVKRELDILEKAGLLSKERRQNRVLYSLNDKAPLYDELQRIVFKESSFVKQLHKSQSRFGKIQFVAATVAFIRKEPIEESDIYLLFVGTIVIPELASFMKEYEELYPYEINYTVMTSEEFKFRKKNADPFIWEFLKKQKVLLMGDEKDLMA